jgi:hypothetical protein
MNERVSLATNRNRSSQTEGTRRLSARAGPAGGTNAFRQRMRSTGVPSTGLVPTTADATTAGRAFGDQFENRVRALVDGECGAEQAATRANLLRANLLRANLLRANLLRVGLARPPTGGPSLSGGLFGYRLPDRLITLVLR